MDLTRTQRKHNRLLSQKSKVLCLVLLSRRGHDDRFSVEILDCENLTALQNYLGRASGDEHPLYTRVLRLAARESRVPHGLCAWCVDGLNPYVLRVGAQQLCKETYASRRDVIVCSVGDGYRVGGLHCEPGTKQDGGAKLGVWCHVERWHAGTRTGDVSEEAGDEVAACAVAAEDEVLGGNVFLVQQHADCFDGLDQLPGIRNVRHERVLEERNLAGVASCRHALHHGEVRASNHGIEVAAAMAVKQRLSVCLLGVNGGSAEGDKVQHGAGELVAAGVCCADAGSDACGDGHADLAVRQLVRGAFGADGVSCEDAMGVGVFLAVVEREAHSADG